MEPFGGNAERALTAGPDIATKDRQPETWAAMDELDRGIGSLAGQIEELSQVADNLIEKVVSVTAPTEPEPGQTRDEVGPPPRRAYGSSVATNVADRAGQVAACADAVAAIKRRLTLLSARIEL